MNKAVIYVGISVVSAAAGAAVGYSWAIRRAREEYDTIMSEEIQAIKEGYKVRVKADYPTPKEAAEALLEEGALQVLERPEEIGTRELENIAKGLRYDGMFRGTKDEGLPQKVREEVFGTPPGPRNEIIFAEVAADLPFADPEDVGELVEDKEVDEVARVEPAKLKQRRPYAISRQDFFHSEDDYDQVQWTYFVGGGPGNEVMIDSQDKPVTTINQMVGVANLSKFGELSGDPKVLYVRNDMLSLDFEIVLHTGTPEDVFEGYSEGRRRKPNRRQDADE